MTVKLYIAFCHFFQTQNHPTETVFPMQDNKRDLDRSFLRYAKSSKRSGTKMPDLLYLFSYAVYRVLTRLLHGKRIWFIFCKVQKTTNRIAHHIRHRLLCIKSHMR